MYRLKKRTQKRHTHTHTKKEARILVWLLVLLKTEVSSITLGPVWIPNQTLGIEETMADMSLMPFKSPLCQPTFQGGTRILYILCDIP